MLFQTVFPHVCLRLNSDQPRVRFQVLDTLLRFLLQSDFDSPPIEKGGLANLSCRIPLNLGWPLWLHKLTKRKWSWVTSEPRSLRRPALPAWSLGMLALGAPPPRYMEAQPAQVKRLHGEVTPRVSPRQPCRGTSHQPYTWGLFTWYPCPLGAKSPPPPPRHPSWDGDGEHRIPTLENGEIHLSVSCLNSWPTGSEGYKSERIKWLSFATTFGGVCYVAVAAKPPS